MRAGWIIAPVMAAGVLTLDHALADLTHTRVAHAQAANPVDQVAGANDPIARLNARIRAGSTTLPFDGSLGYLRAVLRTLDIPVESQLLVFSPTSRQRDNISFETPRAVYFNDRAAVGFVSGGDLEVIVQEPGQGLVFYTLEQRAQNPPQFVRGRDCMQCHLLPETGGAGGLLMMSTLPLSDSKYDYARGWAVDDRTPFPDRWGGWYVTGAQVPRVHLGNVPVQHVAQSYVRAPAAPRFRTMEQRLTRAEYATPHSDVVALLALGHQVRTVNLMTELRWRSNAEATRPATSPASGRAVMAVVHDLVDALLFVGEEAFPAPIRGESGFAQTFAAKAPRDRQGRSLFDLDLRTRLLRYRCSYLIYSETFDAIPPDTRALVYRRLSDLLSGSVSPAAGTVPASERRAIIEILRETKSEIATYLK